MATAANRSVSFSNSSIWDSRSVIEAAHVLVASNSEPVQRQIADPLERTGYEVSRSRCGLDVLDHIGPRSRNPRAQEPVDLVVLDISGDPWVGLALLEAIRRQDWALPVILVAGQVSDAIRDAIRAEARRLGVQEIFDRPLDPERLAAAVLSIEPPIATYSLCA